MTRDEQLALIEAARRKLLQWAKRRDIPLHRIEFVVPFVETDFGLTAWFFFETDEQLQQSGERGWADRLASQLSEVLRRLGYAPEGLPEIRPRFDSHESVVRDYQGSYFYRLR